MRHKPASQQERSRSLPTHEIQVEEHVKIPMHDGTLLDATVWRPAQPGTYPVIVERDGYENSERSGGKAEFYAKRGYVFVKQNVRGCYASEGEYGWFRDDAWGANRDGYDTIEWAGLQPWSNGRVGMVGGSYSGMTQYLTAPTRPPHLCALFVRYATSNVHTLLFRAGAYHLTRYLGIVLFHTFDDMQLSETESSTVQKATEEMEFWRWHLPLKPLPPLAGISTGRALYTDPLGHPDDGPYWWPLNIKHKYAEVDVPIIHFAGWFDTNLDVMIQSFTGIRAHGRTEQCRQSQRLVIGPWIHTEEAGRHVGEADFGPEAVIDLDDFRLPWYDHWLKGIDNDVMDEPAVRVFLMGENRWLDLDDWPPPEIAYSPIYFRAGSGRSHDSLNRGRLTFEGPDEDEPADRFVFDPHDPVPSLVEYPEIGPRDYRVAESRLLTYTSDLLEQDLALVGPVTAVLYGLSSAPDTDWVVRLCDVYPDGRSMSVCDGILRARYRNSLQDPAMLTPGQIYRYKVDLWATAHTFIAGHQLRVHVTSSDFPRYDRNLNTGGPFGEETQGRVAINTIFHDSMRASHVVLPRWRP